MDAKAYASLVQSEIDGWKSKLKDVRKKTEKLTLGEKKRIQSMIIEFETLLSDLEVRSNQLKDDDSSDWGYYRIIIEGRIIKIKKNWKDLWGLIVHFNAEASS